MLPKPEFLAITIEQARARAVAEAKAGHAKVAESPIDSGTRMQRQ